MARPSLDETQKRTYNPSTNNEKYEQAKQKASQSVEKGKQVAGDAEPATKKKPMGWKQKAKNFLKPSTGVKMLGRAAAVPGMAITAYETTKAIDDATGNVMSGNVRRSVGQGLDAIGYGDSDVGKMSFSANDPEIIKAKQARLAREQNTASVANQTSRQDELDTDAFQTAFNAEQGNKQGGVVPYASRGISTANPNLAARDSTGGVQGAWDSSGKQIYVREGIGPRKDGRFNDRFATEAEARAETQRRVEEGNLVSAIRKDSRNIAKNMAGKRTGIFGNREFGTNNAERLLNKRAETQADLAAARSKGALTQGDLLTDQRQREFQQNKLDEQTRGRFADIGELIAKGRNAETPDKNLVDEGFSRAFSQDSNDPEVFRSQLELIGKELQRASGLDKDVFDSILGKKHGIDFNNLTPDAISKITSEPGALMGILEAELNFPGGQDIEHSDIHPRALQFLKKLGGAREVQ